MIAGRQILRMSALCAGILAVLAASSRAQPVGGAPATLSDADITRILANRIDVQRQPTHHRAPRHQRVDLAIGVAAVSAAAG